MKKYILVLLLLLFSFSLTVKAEEGTSTGTASLSFNNKSFTEGLSSGFLSDDEEYYMIAIIDASASDEESSTAQFIAATLYIPKDLLVAGTHELLILKPTKESNNATSCSDETKKFTLPSNDKVYLVLADTSLSINSSFFTIKGVVASEDDGSGTVTFNSIETVSSLATTVEGSFEIHTTNSKYSAQVPSSAIFSCQKALKQTKVKITKNVGTSDATASFTSFIFTDTDTDIPDELEFLGLPTRGFHIKK